MTTQTTRGRGRPRGAPKVMLPVKMTPDQRKRFKTACAEEGLTYGEFITRWLDAREATLARQRRAQAHPLHQPSTAPKSHYPGGGTP